MAENEWTEELKQEVVDAYVAQNPTPETTMEIVKGLAEEFNKTPNGVRMVLTKADVYVKKTVSTSPKTGGEGSKRVNKAEAIDTLKKTIAKLGKEVDEDICDRLTGKAAVYFTSILDA